MKLLSSYIYIYKCISSQNCWLWFKSDHTQTSSHQSVMVIQKHSWLTSIDVVDSVPALMSVFACRDKSQDENVPSWDHTIDYRDWRLVITGDLHCSCDATQGRRWWSCSYHVVIDLFLVGVLAHYLLQAGLACVPKYAEVSTVPMHVPAACIANAEQAVALVLRLPFICVSHRRAHSWCCVAS